MISNDTIFVVHQTNQKTIAMRQENLNGYKFHYEESGSGNNTAGQT